MSDTYNKIVKLKQEYTKTKDHKPTILRLTSEDFSSLLDDGKIDIVSLHDFEQCCEMEIEFTEHERENTYVTCEKDCIACQTSVYIIESSGPDQNNSMIAHLIDLHTSFISLHVEEPELLYITREKYGALIAESKKMELDLGTARKTLLGATIKVLTQGETHFSFIEKTCAGCGAVAQHRRCKRCDSEV